MSAPQKPAAKSAFSALLGSLNTSSTVTVPARGRPAERLPETPEDIQAAMEAAMARIRAGGIRPAPPQREAEAQPDAKTAILAALAEGPQPLAAIAVATGLAPGALIDALRPLEEFRLLRRVDRGEDFAFELTQAGRDLAAAGR